MNMNVVKIQQWTNGTIDREIVPFSAEMVKSIRL